MLPANKNIATASIPINNILNTTRIVPVAGSVNGQTKVLSQGLDGVVRTLALAICNTSISLFSLHTNKNRKPTTLRRLSHDMSDVIRRASAEDIAQTLRALQTLRIQAVSRIRLLAVADEVDDGVGDGESRQEGEGENLEHRELLELSLFCSNT